MTDDQQTERPKRQRFCGKPGCDAHPVPENAGIHGGCKRNVPNTAG